MVSGVTPTVNATASMGNVGLEGRKTEPCNLPPPAAPYHYPSSRGPSVSSSEGSNHHRYSQLENSISEATTETMFLSPTDSDVITPPTPSNQITHNLMYYPKQSRQLAPHQGLNPTVCSEYAQVIRRRYECAWEYVSREPTFRGRHEQWYWW